MVASVEPAPNGRGWVAHWKQHKWSKPHDTGSVTELRTCRSRLRAGRGRLAVDGRRATTFGFRVGHCHGLAGSCHPHLVKAIAEQAAKVMHTSNLYRIP